MSELNQFHNTDVEFFLGTNSSILLSVPLPLSAPMLPDMQRTDSVLKSHYNCVMRVAFKVKDRNSCRDEGMNVTDTREHVHAIQRLERTQFQVIDAPVSVSSPTPQHSRINRKFTKDGGRTRRWCRGALFQLSLLAVLHGTLALLTTVQQLELLNTIHDPPVAVQRIPSPSYLALHLAGLHGCDIERKDFHCK
ncbi:hypothetical protein F2P81_021912 [Scophthalmus maximus]|uniref:Uncharacterized protein n=1 Tax=Scophthalmus maximus TaxID=52904 RepID=A0A6A4S1G4_SCOMX|nr:hypothetical protein F2P81_021912 [Scophthalmus maximus]